jgi:transcriptional regulator with XRE-family HTH domain
MSADAAVIAPEVPVWARLHLARFMAGMEIRELAAKTGISRNTIHNYESGDWDRKRNPAYIRLWELATGVSYQWLSGEVPTSGDGATVKRMGKRTQDALGRVSRFRLRAA